MEGKNRPAICAVYMEFKETFFWIYMYKIEVGKSDWTVLKCFTFVQIPFIFKLVIEFW